MLVDEVRIKTWGGDGGSGFVSFGEDKFSHRPSGGDGGNGGNVYVEASLNVTDLSRFRFEKNFFAEKGENGMKNMSGRNGKDITLQVPRGTIVHNLTSGDDTELMEVGKQVLVARGGTRGRGNSAFATARTFDPSKYEEGRKGYESDLFLELQLIADIGFVGLPNVGKSSLLNALTGARSKVGNFFFTTLEPYLGVLPNGYIIADIPGLIEGASEGKGLGTKFLRHIRRTKAIAHCISAESDDPQNDYKVIRKELELYGSSLDEKPEILIITKIDSISPEDLKKKEKIYKKISKSYVLSSILDDKLVKKLGEKLMKFAE